MSVSPRLVGLLALIALLPVAVFTVLRSDWVVVVSLVNVLLITVSIAIAMSPHEGHHEPNGA